MLHLSFISFLLVSAPAVSAAVPLHQPPMGRVVHVVDGHTLEIMIEGKRVRLRLAGIVAPGMGQAYSLRSRQSLIAICGGELATIEPLGRDRTGLTLARVKCNGTDANSEQVRRGMARASLQGGSTAPTLYAAEDEARAASRGMWATPIQNR